MSSVECLPLELPPPVGPRVPVGALGIGIVRIFGKRTTRVMSARVCDGRHWDWHWQPPRLLYLLYLRPNVTQDDKSSEHKYCRFLSKHRSLTSGTDAMMIDPKRFVCGR